MENKQKFETVEWNYLYYLLIGLAEKIKRSGFKPEIIVGVARGGWFPARIISDLLDNPHLANIRVEFYVDIYKTVKEPVITQQVSTSVKNKRVLIVDDITDSGKSLKIVRNKLENEATGVRTATLYHKPWSSYKPDFYARETDAWVIFPWEYHEMTKLLGTRLLNEGRSLEQVEKELVRVGLKADIVKRFVKDIFVKSKHD